MANIAMLGTGLIGMFYTMSLQAKRGRDQIVVVCAKSDDEVKVFCREVAHPQLDDEHRRSSAASRCRCRDCGPAELSS